MYFESDVVVSVHYAEINVIGNANEWKHVMYHQSRLSDTYAQSQYHDSDPLTFERIIQPVIEIVDYF